MIADTLSIEQLVDLLQQRLVHSSESKLGFLAGLVFAEVSPAMAARVLAEIEQRTDKSGEMGDIRSMIQLLADHLD